MKKENKFLLLDANSILHRAFHAVRPLFTESGTQVNAVFGFASILLSILESQKPNFIIAAFDVSKKTFRHDDFPEYKANRPKSPTELYEQIPLIKKFLESLEVPVIESPGYEADDILGTIVSRELNEEKFEKIIFSSDNDILQLVNENTFVAKPGQKGKTDIFDTKKVKEKIGVYPHQIPDFKGLAGDSSDNIPGVPGVGPKTAVSLLDEFPSLENIYENITRIDKKNTYKKISENKEKAFLSKKLATIHLDVPLDFSVSSASFPPVDFGKTEQFLDEINSKGLKKRLQKLQGEEDKELVQGQIFLE